ncbi:MAG: lysyl oxidase family protein [Actinomycetota bacterium]
MRKETVAAIVVALAMIVGTAPVTGAAPETGTPRLSLRRTSSEATAYKYGKRKPRLYAPVFLQVQDAPLDLRVRRAGYEDPLTVSQVLHTSNGTEVLELSADILNGWRGLIDFTEVEVADLEGNVVFSTTRAFCPNSYDRQRIDDAGPPTPTYPQGCYGGRARGSFLRGMVWGVDQSWATNLSGGRGIKLDVPRGRYVLTLSIAPRYQELFGIDGSQASTTLDLRVKKIRRERCCFHAQQAESDPQDQQTAGVPTMDNPDPAILPDLVALPAFYMDVHNRRNGKSKLSFASMFWTGGASSLVVEGFRRPDEDVMDAYQYFYEDDEVVGRAPVGTFEYDRRDGHFHWHIQQFAAYRMVDTETNEVVRSSKQSFCLAPTDPVDLSLDNASWNTERTGLHTACGGAEALWIREVLPLGWGDTYYQAGGQAFNITDLPNGSYFVEVQANPLGLLHEQDASNNSVLREVILKGKPGNRRVEVMPWFGIDF